MAAGVTKATPTISLAALQRVLTLLGVAAPSTYTWKSVRAGHATELALTPGVSLATILSKGEWKSSAVLAYVRPEDMHVPTFMAQTLEQSDAEDGCVGRARLRLGHDVDAVQSSSDAA